MLWLLLGIVLWAGTHLLKSAGRTLRESLLSQLGENRYKGLFSLSIIASLVLIVLGWRSTSPSLVYAPPMWGRYVTLPLMLLALVLFVASGTPSNIKRFLRHPQLTGVAIWAVAHLLSNGDSRAIVLFGGIGLWAVVEMPLINRRDGAWRRPEPQPTSVDVRVAVVAVVAWVVLFFAHPHLFGVAVM